MRVETDYTALHTRNQQAFDVALDKQVLRARQNLKSGGVGRLRSTVHKEIDDRLRGRVGSSEPGAKAQELGAYITPKAKKALKYTWRGQLHFNRKAVRIRAKRWLQRSGDKWGEDMSEALRQVNR